VQPLGQLSHTIATRCATPRHDNQWRFRGRHVTRPTCAMMAPSPHAPSQPFLQQLTFMKQMKLHPLVESPLPAWSKPSRAGHCGTDQANLLTPDTTSSTPHAAAMALKNAACHSTQASALQVAKHGESVRSPLNVCDWDAMAVSRSLHAVHLADIQLHVGRRLSHVGRVCTSQLGSRSHQESAQLLAPTASNSAGNTFWTSPEATAIK
jgi:hypothetical protein